MTTKVSEVVGMGDIAMQMVASAGSSVLATEQTADSDFDVE